jgi:Putative beta-barrel porin 2
LFSRFSLVCLCLAAAARASAQAPEEDPAASARFQVGPLRFTPGIAITNLGVDNNVFNDPNNRQKDTTAAIGPIAKLWLDVGRSRLTSNVSVQYLYFNEFDNQRAFNTANDGKWEVPLARLTPFVTGSYSNTKDRPGFEIDARSRLVNSSVGLGTSLRLSGKTSFVLSATRSRLIFDPDQTFDGTDLGRALNRTSDAEQLQLRYAMTSLTTFVVDTEARQDRFTEDQLRSADSIKVLPGFEMKPSALIAGTVFVGYRRFEPLDATLPSYQGPVATVNARYVNGATMVETKIGRDLAYSYEPTQPYYALTDLNLAVTERLLRNWDVVGRAAWQTLDYQQLNTVASSSNRTDTIHQFGGGIGYWVGRTLRVGFDANYYERRSSDLAQFGYEGLRMGASVRYGLIQ